MCIVCRIYFCFAGKLQQILRFQNTHALSRVSRDMFSRKIKDLIIAPLVNNLLIGFTEDKH